MKGQTISTGQRLSEIGPKFDCIRMNSRYADCIGYYVSSIYSFILNVVVLVSE